MKMTETAIPTTSRAGRTPLPNPFTEKFPADSAALTFTVAEGRDSVEARRLVRQARQAAKRVDRTARITLTDTPKGVEFTVWTVERMVRGGQTTVKADPTPAKKKAAPARKKA